MVNGKWLTRSNISLLLIIITLLCFTACSHSASERRKDKGAILTPEELLLLSNGDLIFRQGSGVLSEKICDVLNEDVAVSHVGILVDTDSGFFVIHTISGTLVPVNGVQLSSLSFFVDQAVPQSLIVSRLKNCTDKEIVAVVKCANGYLEKQLPFDHTFDFDNNDALCCTELVWLALKEGAHRDVLCHSNGLKKGWSMAAFLDSTNFQLILNQHP